MWLKYLKYILQSKVSLVCVRWRHVGHSAVPAALRRSHTTTPTSTNATSASTSSSRCTATCHCCTRSSAWTPCCSRLVYPTTRPSASSSSSTGLSGPAIIAKSEEWIEGLKVEQHCGQQQDGWKDGWTDCQTKAQEESMCWKITLTCVGLWWNLQVYIKSEEWELEGTTANKNEPFQWMSLLLSRVLQSCSVINHYRCHLHLLMACWEKRAVVRSIQKLTTRKNPTWQWSCHSLNHWQTDVRLRSAQQPVSLSAGRANSGTGLPSSYYYYLAHFILFYIHTVPNCTSCTCTLEKHWWSEVFHCAVSLFFFFFFLMVV